MGNDEAIQANALIRALCEINRDAILLTAPDGSGIYCNEAFCALFHIRPERVAGCPCEEIFQVGTRRGFPPATLNNWLHRSFATPPQTFEDKIVVPFVLPVRLLMYTEPILSPEGDLTGRLWRVSVDREENNLKENKTENKTENITENITESNLEEGGEIMTIPAIGTLATGIAHDLRNILATLRMEMAEMEISAYKASVTRQVNRLHVLTYSLLALSEEDLLPMGPVDLSEIVRFVCGLMRELAEMDSVTLQMDFSSSKELPRAHGNARRLEHLFVVLLRNALTAAAMTVGIVTVRLSLDSDRLRVDIEDTGPGIPAENLPHLFEQFFTTHANRAGLGLFSAKRIVQAHRGEISVASQPGEGTCVSVWLPMAV